MSAEAALERVRALAQSWASLPGDDAAAEVDRRVGLIILGVLHAYAESPGGAPERLDAVRQLAEGWGKPGGPGLFYPAAGQAVLDAIRGGSTEEEAGWRSRAEKAEAKLAALRALAAEWERLGEEEDGMTPFRTGNRAALRKCADELGYELGSEPPPGALL